MLAMDGRLLSLASDPAKALGSNAQEGGDLMIGHALLDVGIALNELLITLFRGFGQVASYSQVKCRDRPLIEQPEIFIHLRHLFEDGIKILHINPKQLRILDAINVVQRGRLAEQAGEITRPPILRREPDDVFLAFIVYAVSPRKTLYNEIVVVDNVSLLNDVLVLPVFTKVKTIPQNVFVRC
jgi:hypothetical protein